MTTQQVRRRAQQRPPDRSGVWLAVLGVLVVVVAGGAFVALAHNNRGTDDSTPAAAASTSPQSSATGASPSSSAAVGQDVAAAVYLVGDAARGPRLYRDVRAMSGVTPSQELQRAVQAAVSGTSSDPDYRTVWPSGVTASITSSSSAVVTVDLRGSTSALSAAPAAGTGALGLQAVVYTVDAVLGRGLPVTFTVGGQATASVLGVDASTPVAKADPLTVQAPVMVSRPVNGARVGTTFRVAGIATTTEANVVWELKQGAEVVQQGHATAKECCTASPYRFTVRGVPAGTYTLVVHDSDDSGEGGAPDQDTKTVTVR